MAETEHPNTPEPSDEVAFADDPIDSGSFRRGDGFRLDDSGHDALSDLGLVDASPDEPEASDPAPEAADARPGAHDSGTVSFLDASPDADPGERFTPRAAAPALPPKPVASNKRANEFYAPGVETHAPPRPSERGTSQAGYALCPACEAKNPAEARRCGRCGQDLPAAIPAGAPRGVTAPGMAVKVTVAREVAGPVDEDALPTHARLTIQARRVAQEEARQASAARWQARRQRVMLSAAGVFLVAGFVPSLFLVSGWLWLLVVPLDLAVGAGVARFLLDRDAHNVSGQLSFGVGMAGSLLVKGGLGATLDGFSLVLLFGACFVGLTLAVLAGGFVGHSLERSALDEA